METLPAILPYIQIALSILLVLAIILQQTGAGLGGAFGGSDSSSGFHTRRGFEKTLFNMTIVLAILFVLTAFTALIIR
jgi:preprotein translocase subunit SecG